MFESASTITGAVTSIASTTKTYSTSIGVVEINGVLTLQHWLNQDENAVRQVQTLTIDNTLPVADAYYIITASNGDQHTYYFNQPNSLTSAQVATAIAAMLERDPATAASATNNVITLTTLSAGASATVTAEVRNAVDNSLNAGKITVAQTVAPAGTSSRRLITQIAVTDALRNESVALDMATTFYNGDNPATVRSTTSLSVNHTRTITQLATA